MKFETVLYSFAILLLALISLPDGNDRSDQNNMQNTEQLEKSNSINIASAKTEAQMDLSTSEEASEETAPEEEEDH